MSDINKCPFCGGTVEMEYSLHTDSFEFTCNMCGVNVDFERRGRNQQFGVKERSKSEAIKKWNRRTKKLVFYCDETVDIPDCTVRIYRNTQTGEEDWGWFRNDKPPKEIGMVTE